jgi:hypothetical protein
VTVEIVVADANAHAAHLAAIGAESNAANQSLFAKGRLAGLRRKLGLCTEREGDAALAKDLFTLAHNPEVP